MKNMISVLREYPLTAAMLLTADIFVTARFVSVSAESDPLYITYSILLYGSFLAVSIFCIGWSKARSSAEKKAEQQRRERRRSMISRAYRAEFYGITER